MCAERDGPVVSEEHAFDEHSHRMRCACGALRRAALLAWSARFHRGMLYDATTFNGDLSSWNVSNVTNMRQVMSVHFRRIRTV